MIFGTTGRDAERREEEGKGEKRTPTLEGSIKNKDSGDWEVAREIRGEWRECHSIMEARAKTRFQEEEMITRVKSYRWVKKGKGCKVTVNSGTSRISDSWDNSFSREAGTKNQDDARLREVAGYGSLFSMRTFFIKKRTAQGRGIRGSQKCFLTIEIWFCLGLWFSV